MAAPSLEVFKARLDGAGNNPKDAQKMPVSRPGGADELIFERPFQPNPFCDSVLEVFKARLGWNLSNLM